MEVELFNRNGQIEVKWKYKEFDNGNSLGIIFQDEKSFLDTCEAMERAKEMFFENKDYLDKFKEQ